MTRQKTLTLTLACTLALFAVVSAPASAHAGDAFVPFNHASAAPHTQPARHTGATQHRFGGYANPSENRPGGVCDVGDNPMIC
jgi:hypothetical protein